MRNLRLKSTSRRLLLVAGFAGLPFISGVAYGRHHVECNQTAINALKADIQAMGEGEATTTATKEVEAAQQMMAKNDMEGCKSHIHSAMEATENRSPCWSAGSPWAIVAGALLVLVGAAAVAIYAGLYTRG